MHGSAILPLTKRRIHGERRAKMLISFPARSQTEGRSSRPRWWRVPLGEGKCSLAGLKRNGLEIVSVSILADGCGLVGCVISMESGVDRLERPHERLSPGEIQRSLCGSEARKRERKQGRSHRAKSVTEGLLGEPLSTCVAAFNGRPNRSFCGSAREGNSIQFAPPLISFHQHGANLKSGSESRPIASRK